MAKDILVTESLSEQMIEAGTKLLEKLDAAGSGVRSAFWLFFPDEKIWKLIIASPLVSSDGPRKFYQRVVEVNQEVDEEENIVSLNDIEVTNTDHQIVQLLNFAMKTGDDISGIRFSRNTINGIFIDDSYIYRSNI